MSEDKISFIAQRSERPRAVLVQRAETDGMNAAEQFLPGGGKDFRSCTGAESINRRANRESETDTRPGYAENKGVKTLKN